tara:strand:- start:47 stop:244 length:198 start_codon:yes stop_codon:yes gene_type:complete
MKLLLFSLLLFITPPVMAQDCYGGEDSSFLLLVCEKGEIAVPECYWKGDRKFCKLNTTEPWRRVY